MTPTSRQLDKYCNCNILITDCNDSRPEASAAASPRRGPPRARPRAHPGRAGPRQSRRSSAQTISQSYLSLIEKGTRPHLSHESRQLLARFFKVHPGYLVSDPPGYPDRAHVRRRVGRNRARSLAAATARRGSRTIRRSAPRSIGSRAHAESRRCLVLLGEMISMPGLVDRLSRDARSGGADMNWPAIFLGCFVIGFVLSALSFAFGVDRRARPLSVGDRTSTSARPARPATRTAHRADQLRDHHGVPRLVRRHRLPADDASSAGWRCRRSALSVARRARRRRPSCSG